LKRILGSRLVRNTGWMFLGQGLGYGLKIAYFIVIARLLGVLQYGIVVGAFALVNLVANYSRLGMGTVLLRYVSPNHGRFAEYWGNILIVTAAMGGVLILLLRVAAPHILSPASADVVVLTAVASALCEQLTMSATQAFQAFQRMRIAAVLGQLSPMCRTIAAVGMLVVMHHATARQWVLALAISSAVAAIMAASVATMLLGWPDFKPHLIHKRAREGAQYAFADSTATVYNDLDKTMLSHYGMNAANGIYGMAYRIIEMGSVPFASIQLAAEPRLFELAGNGNYEPIKLGRKLLRHSVLVSTVAAIGMFVSAPMIPLLAGKGFGEAVSALRWLCVIPIFRSVHGVTGSVLTSLGLQRYRTMTQIAAAVLNFGLNLWLIPRYGWHGAAWASLLTDGTLGAANWCVLEREGKKLMGHLAYRLV
jgi:O-antigen/teichoic acid export membrane protein